MRSVCVEDGRPDGDCCGVTSAISCQEGYTLTTRKGLGCPYDHGNTCCIRKGGADQTAAPATTANPFKEDDDEEEEKDSAYGRCVAEKCSACPGVQWPAGWGSNVDIEAAFIKVNVLFEGLCGFVCFANNNKKETKKKQKETERVRFVPQFGNSIAFVFAVGVACVGMPVLTVYCSIYAYDVISLSPTKTAGQSSGCLVCQLRMYILQQLSRVGNVAWENPGLPVSGRRQWRAARRRMLHLPAGIIPPFSRVAACLFIWPK